MKFFIHSDQISYGSLLSYLNLILDNIVSILLVPVILMHLGQAEYGLYALMGSLVSYLVVLDFGLNSTIIRYIAKYRAEKDEKGQANFLAICLILYTIISLAVLVLGFILLQNIPNIFKNTLNPNEITKARLLFAILVANLALSLPLKSFQAVVNGHEHFIFPRLLVTFRTVVRPAILLVLLLSGYKSVAIVVLDMILNLSILFSIMLYASFVLKVRVKLYKFDRLVIKEISGFSFFVFLGVVVNQIYWRLGQVILGILANTIAVAVFSIGIQFVYYFMAFSVVIMQLFLPKATQMVVNNESNEKLTDLFIKTGRIQLIILGYILVGFLILGRNFIQLWVGQEYINAWTIALIIMVPLTIPLCQNIGINILMAKNLHAFRSVVYLFVAIGNLIISVLLTKRYGIWGPAIGTSLALVMGNIIVINLYYHSKIGLDMVRFFTELSRGLLPVLFISIIIGILVLLIPGISWHVLLIQGILLSAFYWILMWRMGMNDKERALISALSKQFNFNGLRP